MNHNNYLLQLANVSSSPDAQSSVPSHNQSLEMHLLSKHRYSLLVHAADNKL